MVKLVNYVNFGGSIPIDLIAKNLIDLTSSLFVVYMVATLCTNY